MSLTNFGSILIFASCVVGTCNILCVGVDILKNIFHVVDVVFPKTCAQFFPKNVRSFV